VQNRAMQKKVRILAMFLVAFVSMTMAAKEPIQSLNWPSDQNPVLRFTVNNITRMGSYGRQSNYSLDVTVQNLSGKPISRAMFTVYFYNKNNVRIGDGWLELTNVGAQQTVKAPLQAELAGTPTSVNVTAKELPPELAALAPPKLIPINIYSVPAGASLKVDGKDAGFTPVATKLTVGSHMLGFSKDGYATGTFPLLISPDQLAGGTVSFELGGVSHDTVELRDGTMIQGDVESVDAHNVVVELGGKAQSLDRNQVKRISLVQRTNE
jgi:hypothetical protein